MAYTNIASSSSSRFPRNMYRVWRWEFHRLHATPHATSTSLYTYTTQTAHHPTRQNVSLYALSLSLSLCFRLSASQISPPHENASAVPRKKCVCIINICMYSRLMYCDVLLLPTLLIGSMQCFPRRRHHNTLARSVMLIHAMSCGAVCLCLQL